MTGAASRTLYRGVTAGRRLPQFSYGWPISVVACPASAQRWHDRCDRLFSDHSYDQARRPEAGVL